MAINDFSNMLKAKIIDDILYSYSNRLESIDIDLSKPISEADAVIESIADKLKNSNNESYIFKEEELAYLPKLPKLFKLIENYILTENKNNKVKVDVERTGGGGANTLMKVTLTIPERQSGKPPALVNTTFRRPTEDIGRLVTDDLIDSLIKIKGSPSYTDVVLSKILVAIKSNSAKRLNLSEYSVELQKQIRSNKYLSIYRTQLKQQYAELDKAKKLAEKQAAKNKAKIAAMKRDALVKIRTLDMEELSPLRLKYLLNIKLKPKLKENMKRPRLIYRTGRFATSVVVTQIATRAKSLEVFYTYMKYPYQVFEHDKFYDPRSLIEKSIREIASTITKQRFSLERL